MKKIGCVIAYRPGHNNYGTSLQAFAMLRKIESLDYQVEVINYVKKLTLWQKINYVINGVRAGYWTTIKDMIANKSVLKKYPHYANGIEQRTAAVDIYKEKYLLPYFCNYEGFDKLQEGSRKYDAVIVGSDQVWTPLGLYNKFFNLLFVDDCVPKLAYASSFGVSTIPNFQKRATGRYLDRFSFIGVREQSGKCIVDSLSNKKATVVADPTLLLSREEWEDEIKNARPNESRPYIFCYFLGANQQARKAANELKEITGYRIITIRHMDEYVAEDEKFGDEAPYFVDPNDFIKYISLASYVCTDSFHCTVFSLIFRRKFMSFYRYANDSKTSRNSRIDSLFNMLGVTGRLFTGNNIRDIEKDLDYNLIETKIKDIREKSIDFLRNSISSVL